MNWLLFASVVSLVSKVFPLACPPSNGRQGASLNFSNPSGSPFLFAAPTNEKNVNMIRDTGLFYPDITVETFVKLQNVSNIFHPLIGNLNGAFDSNAGFGSGWRLACRQTTCCFQAYIGYKWVVRVAGYDSKFRNDRQTLSLQQVCTTQAVPIREWFHLAASYSSSTGVAMIFVNGTLHSKQSFRAVGDPEFGFDTGTQINYDYLFDNQPWTADPTATGYTVSRLFLGTSSMSFDPSSSAPTAPIPAVYFKGFLSEVRVWSVARSEGDVAAGAFEVGERATPGDCATPFVRLASFRDLSTLELYLNDATLSGGFVANQAPGAGLKGLNGSGPVTAFLDPVMFIDRLPFFAPLDAAAAGRRAAGNCSAPRGATAVAAAGGGGAACVGDLFAFGAAAVSIRLAIQSLNYDDTLYLVPPSDDSLAYPPTLCTQCAGALPLQTRAIPQADTKVNSGSLTVSWGAAGAFDDAASVPLGGYTLAFTLRVVRCGRCAASRGESVFSYRGQWTVAAAPRVTLFPGPSAAAAAAALPPDGDVWVGVGRQLLLAVSAQVKNPGAALLVRSRSGPAGGLLGAAVVAAPDACSPAAAEARFTFAPAGADAGAVLRQCFSAQSFPGAQQTACPASCAAACAAAAAALAATAAPAESREDACVWVRVPLPDVRLGLLPVAADAAPGGPADPGSLGPVEGTGWEAYPADQEVVGFVGCRLGGAAGLTFRAEDLSTAAAAAAGQGSLPYDIDIAATESGTQACDASACRPIPTGLPAGAALRPAASAWLQAAPAGAGRAEANLDWVPTRGQETDRPLRVCLSAGPAQGGPAAAALAAAGRLRRAVTCYQVSVLKCHYCLSGQETLASLARQLAVDPLQLVFSNPRLEQPDLAPAGQPLRYGPLYRVREGDVLGDVASRFLVSPAALEAVNPDVAAAEGVLRAGGRLCVPAPVCDVRCLHGTDCRV